MKKSVYALLAVLAFLGCTKDPKEAPDDIQPVKVTGVSISQPSLSLFVGQEATLTATVSPNDAENTTVSWSSSNSAVASVEKGLVKAKSVGETVVTVKTEDGGFTASCTVRVDEEEVVIHVSGVSLDQTSLEMFVGDQVTLSATVTPADATNKEIHWSSSDASIAKVEGGKVSAVAPGKAIITVSTEEGGFTASCSVTVTEEVVDIPVSGVSMDHKALELIVNDQVTLTATVAPDNATNKGISWNSSDASIASVEGGKVTALSTGEAVITVTTDDGGFTASCAVTVNESSKVITYTTSDGMPVYVNLPESIGTLVSNTYLGDRGLLVFEEGIIAIGERAFQSSSTLTGIDLPSTVTSIGAGAFMGCSSLASIVIPSAVTSIGAGAFAGCTSLSSFSGALASSDNRSLIDGGTLIAIAPAGLTEFTVPSDVTSLGKSVFSNCSELIKIQLPEGLENIGDGAFKGCSKLKSIMIPDGVERIPVSAFEGCTSLSDVNLPSTILVIGQYAFRSCSALKDVVLPGGVQTLDDNCFGSCNVLTSVDLPSTVISVGNTAFSNCRSLSSVTVRASEPPRLGGSVFNGVPTYCSFFVPAESLEKYKDSSWNDYNGRLYPLQ